MHAEICGILLGSLEGLQSALAVCGSAGVLLTPEESTNNSVVGEVAQRLKELSDIGKVRLLESYTCITSWNLIRRWALELEVSPPLLVSIYLSTAAPSFKHVVGFPVSIIVYMVLGSNLRILIQNHPTDNCFIIRPYNSFTY